MNIPWWVAELAATFWKQAGEAEAFPRSLRGPIAAAFPLAILTLPALSLASVREYLSQRRIPFPLEGAAGPLRACLTVRGGGGFIFLDAGDPTDEQRFSLAHELAHFLRHYWQPRCQARARLGDAILEVLDGRRLPGPGERLDAVLAGVRLGYHAHLMRRDARRRATGVIARVEEEADRLAYELLAPAGALAVRLGGGSLTERRVQAAAELRSFFGLPAQQAEEYAAIVFPTTASDPLLAHLRLNS